MSNLSSFSDRFLIQAASQYVYEMSFYNIYKDSLFTVAMNLKKDYHGRYEIEHYESKAFNRNDERIDLRYIVFRDTQSDECALVFQGSDGSLSNLFSGEDNDWSNNLSSAAHLPLLNYDLAKAEYEYLQGLMDDKITAVSGNSLGGAYALYIADFYPHLRAIGLNAAPKEFGHKYKENENSCLLLTSSDVLSRSVSLDVARLEGDPDVTIQINKSTAERIYEAYGIKPYIVSRSIPYSSMTNIMIGHVSSMRNYRERLLELYNENFIFYNARIIRVHKEWKEFSKYLLQKTYRELEQEDYRFFTEKYIYPNMTQCDRGIVDTYKYYPQLEDFMVFDIKTQNMIHKDGSCLTHTDYTIEDSYAFINSMNLMNSKYTKSKDFYLLNSFFELKSIFEDEGFTFNKKKFLSQTLKLSMDWDWMFAKMFIDMPLPVKLKTGEFLEQNISFIYRINNKLSADYNLNALFTKEDVEGYVNDLIQVMLRLSDHHKKLVSYHDDLVSNLEMMLYVNEHKLKDDPQLYVYSQKNESLSLEDLKYLKLALMNEQMMCAKEAGIQNAAIVEEGMVDLAKSLKSVLFVVLENLESSIEKTNDSRSKKLYSQVKGLIDNFDIESFLQMALYEFEDEITAYLLKESVALTVFYNIKQMIELNENYYSYLNNLDLYMKNSLKKSQYEHYTIQKELLINHLQDEQDCLSELITNRKHDNK